MTLRSWSVIERDCRWRLKNAGSNRVGNARGDNLFVEASQDAGSVALLEVFDHRTNHRIADCLFEIVLEEFGEVLVAEFDEGFRKFVQFVTATKAQFVGRSFALANTARLEVGISNIWQGFCLLRLGLGGVHLLLGELLRLSFLTLLASLGLALVRLLFAVMRLGIQIAILLSGLFLTGGFGREVAIKGLGSDNI